MTLARFAFHRSYLRTLSTLIVMGAAACSSAARAPTTAAASLAGGSVVVVKSAALIESGTITEAGLGTSTTYIQFFSNAPGASCAALDASSIALAGSLAITADPSTLAGKTFTFGSSPNPILSLSATASADASTDGSATDVDAGGATEGLVAVSGTVKFGDSSSDLTGTIDAQMVQASSPGSTPVEVTGTFTAPSCGDY